MPQADMILFNYLNGLFGSPSLANLPISPDGFLRRSPDPLLLASLYQPPDPWQQIQVLQALEQSLGLNTPKPTRPRNWVPVRDSSPGLPAPSRPRLQGTKATIPSSSLMFPLPGYKASHGFGEYRKAEPGKKAHRHAGEDVPALKGTKIFPMGEKGVVVYVGEATNFGENTIIISYPGIEDEKGNIAYSVYGHCNAAYVKAGDIVNRDTPVGEVGDDHSSSSHLHYQVHFGPPGLGREIFAYAPSDPRKFLIS